MKKLIIISLLLFYIIHLFADNNGTVTILFKDGQSLTYTAESVWTEYNPHHNFLRYFSYADYEGNKENIYDQGYFCLCDYCCMNPVSHDTKEADYKNIRNNINAMGHTCHYFVDNGTVRDDWCISVRYDEIDEIDVAPMYGSANKCYYRDEIKY